MAWNRRSGLEWWSEEYGNDANAELGIKGPEKGVGRHQTLCIVICIAFGCGHVKGGFGAIWVKVL